jgi:hypothetical protein
MKVTERILQLFLQTGTVRILPFVVLLLPNQNSKELNACSSPTSAADSISSIIGWENLDVSSSLSGQD